MRGGGHDSGEFILNNLFAVVASLLLSVPVFAQQPLPAEQPVPAQQPLQIAPASSQQVFLRAGTPLTLKTLTQLTTKGKHLKVGDRFSLEVADPVSLQGQVVIPVGSNAVGEVTSIRNKGMWGKSGNIETRMLYVTANDRRIRLSGAVSDKGVKAGGGAIATSAIVFLPAGFFMTGTSAVIPPGTRVTALLDEDVPIVFAAPVQAMAVSAPAPVIVAASALPAASVPRAPPAAVINAK
jgi:hypothetical protein